MKSTRITKINGTFMGKEFTVKPTPLNMADVDSEIREMLLGWYREKHPSLAEKLERGADIDELTKDEVMAVTAWQKDVDFRASYIRRMAESCMEFESPVPEEYWRRDDLPYSIVKEAWDFFCERRRA